MIDSTQPVAHWSRRKFLKRSALLGTSTILTSPSVFAAPSPIPHRKIVVFSKVYQTLKLSYEQSSDLTAEAGLDGIDCPVRAGGEVLPERVEEDLPRYAKALALRKVHMPLIVTGIIGVDSPSAEIVLRTARRLGVRHYRLGFQNPSPEMPLAKQLAEVRARFRDLAQLNQDLGLTAVLQNHSPTGKMNYLGGDLQQLWEVVKEFKPANLGVAFDIGHAVAVHGDGWLPHFKRLQPWVRVVYLKDIKRPNQWVPMGEGEIHGTGFLRILKGLDCDENVSLHIEYDWEHGGSTRDRAELLKNIKRDCRIVREWLT